MAMNDAIKQLYISISAVISLNRLQDLTPSLRPDQTRTRARNFQQINQNDGKNPHFLKLEFLSRFS